MKSQRSRLDRFIVCREGIKRSHVHQLLAQGRILLDGLAAEAMSQVVGPFTHVVLDRKVLQAEQPRYIMLHKPPGMVSATCDEQHPTVLDLVSAPYAKALHIVGRLDFNSTGLLLLTNDGRWSRGVSSPQRGLLKPTGCSWNNPLRSEYTSRRLRPVCILPLKTSPLAPLKYEGFLILKLRWIWSKVDITKSNACSAISTIGC